MILRVSRYAKAILLIVTVGAFMTPDSAFAGLHDALPANSLHPENSMSNSSPFWITYARQNVTLTTTRNRDHLAVSSFQSGPQAHVRFWPLADIPVSECRGSYRL
jgi:hypothetical protein